jgi:hypothetical protein
MARSDRSDDAGEKVGVQGDDIAATSARPMQANALPTIGFGSHLPAPGHARGRRTLTLVRAA